MKKGIDFIGVCVVYFCHDGKGNVVFGKRSKNSRDEQERWDIGGGSIEFGDTLENTLKKEIFEEYGTDVLQTEFLGFRDVHREHNGQKTHWISLDFKVLIDPKMVKNNEPHKFDEIRMFKRNEFPKVVHSQLPYFLEKYQDKLW